MTKQLAAKKEQRRAYRKAYYAANLERARATSRAWRTANQERVREQRSAWDAANRERARATSRAWKAANAERTRAHAARRRARLASVLSTLTPQEWEAILEAAGYACIYCGSRERLEQDHLTPISKGGPHTADNVAPACLPCNQSKGARAVMEFLAEA